MDINTEQGNYYRIKTENAATFTNGSSNHQLEAGSSLGFTAAGTSISISGDGVSESTVRLLLISRGYTSQQNITDKGQDNAITGVAERANAHENNSVVHITAAEREKWNTKVDTAALFEDVPFELATPEGESNAMAQYIELDAQYVPQGRLVSVGVKSRSSGNPSACSYLGVWELAEGAADEWVYLGSSANAPGQAVGTMKVWEFGDGGLPLSGRKIRLLAQESRSDVWAEGPQLGLRTTPVPEGDSTRVVNNGRRYSFLPEIELTVRQAVARFAPAAHVDDSSVHVTAEERARWEEAAAVQAAPASHVGDATHLQRDGRLLRILDSSGGTALQVLGNATNATLTSGSLYNNVPDWSLNTIAAAIYDYETSTGVTDVWFAATTSAAALAPLGVAEAGVHVGNANYPLRLKGGVVSINGTDVDVEALAQLAARKDELLALLETSAGNEMSGLKIEAARAI